MKIREIRGDSCYSSTIGAGRPKPSRSELHPFRLDLMLFAPGGRVAFNPFSRAIFQRSRFAKPKQVLVISVDCIGLKTVPNGPLHARSIGYKSEPHHRTRRIPAPTLREAAFIEPYTRAGPTLPGEAWQYISLSAWQSPSWLCADVSVPEGSGDP